MCFQRPVSGCMARSGHAVTDPTLPIPTSSGIFAIIFSIFGCFMVILRHYVWTGRLEWVRNYHPNMMCVSLAFVLPQTYCKSSQPRALYTDYTNRSTRRYCHGNGINRGVLLANEEAEALRDFLLCCGSWFDCWRRNWRCYQCYLTDSRCLWR